MSFSYGFDLKVTLTPERPGRGLKPVVRTVYARYGRAKERTVQEICTAVGGHCVYIEFDGGRHTLPIPSWRCQSDVGANDGSGGALITAADIIQFAMSAQPDAAPVAYGSDRVRWKVAIANVQNPGASDALDAEPDSVGSPGGPFGENDKRTMRKEF